MSRRVLLFTVAATVLLTAAWYVLMWSPQGDALKKANARTTAAEATQRQLHAQLTGLQAAKKNLPDLQAKVASLRAAVPDSPELDHVISSVNDAAKASGVDLGSLAPAPVATDGKAKATSVPGLSEINVTIGATGTYFQLVDFINRLNASPRLIVIDKLAMNGQAADKSQSKVTTQLAGRMFTTGGK